VTERTRCERFEELVLLSPIEKQGYCFSPDAAEATDVVAASFVYSVLALTEGRNIRVRVFPSGEEIIVGFAAVLTVPLQGIGPRETELRQRSKHSPPEPSAMTDEFSNSAAALACSPAAK